VIVSGIDADELGHSTPCPKYDVAGLIDHLVEAGHRRPLSAAAGTPPGDESLTWSSPTRRVNSVALRNRRHKRGRRFELVLDVHHAVGEEYTGTALVDMYLVELSTHAWDLARATGQIEELDPSLALPTLEGARAMIKPHFRNMVEPGALSGGGLPSSRADDWSASLPLWDAIHGERSVSKWPTGR